MPSAASTVTPLPAGVTLPAGSLRAEIDAKRAAGETFSIRQAVSILVPLCGELAELHAEGKTFFVTPASLRRVDDVVELSEVAAAELPAIPRDRACLAPESRKGTPGDARASVFSVGAMLYELLTGASVGPGMQRPSDLVDYLPDGLETLLGKCLVADSKHRPADLGALAQVLHAFAPTGSIAPPDADTSRLDHDGDFDVDVSLSMIPPPIQGAAIPRAPGLPSGMGEGPFGGVIRKTPTARADDPTQALSDMKARLESDPRPRYIVIKDGMDHGPFSAVELLQQIASGSFLAEHVLRDSYSEESRLIDDWEEFAPFANHARLNREIVQEKREFEAVVIAEKKGSKTKAIIAVGVVGALLATFTLVWMQRRASQEKELAVHGETAVAVEVDAGLDAKHKAGGAKRSGGSANGKSYPIIAGGSSCEAAQARYVEEYKIGGGAGQPDLTAGAYQAVLGKGTYLNSCGVPSNMSVNVCAAVQNGRAVGVTVSTNPSNRGIASCISGQVRGMSFPSNPRLDVARTTFSAE